jgi:hypothetical protein
MLSTHQFWGKTQTSTSFLPSRALNAPCRREEVIKSANGRMKIILYIKSARPLFFAAVHEEAQSGLFRFSWEFGLHACTFDMRLAHDDDRKSLSRSPLCTCCVCAPKTKYWLACAVAAKKYPSPADKEEKLYPNEYLLTLSAAQL